MKYATTRNSGIRGSLTHLGRHWQADLTAGFLVFLIALPLCLGVAVASGFPPMSGVISAIVGGLVVSHINGSHLTITGPAAGLIVVILASVQNLGHGDSWAGYHFTLAAIVMSGLFQLILGYFKAGRLVSFFPSSVVHGMLAAIGIIIVTKQLPVMLGVKVQDAPTILASIAQLWQAQAFFVPKIALIAWLSLIVLVGWPHLRQPMLNKIPAPLLAIVGGIALGYGFDLNHFQPDSVFKLPAGIDISGPYLVAVPDSITASLFLPDFSKIGAFAFWESVLSITLIGSLETLLSTTAVDKLDPQQRSSDLNRDLLAIGLGNTISGMIGGLPMIAEIVRSSANIDYGAKTRWANFFHGGFLLLVVALFPHLLAAIPLASLAALLVYVGFKLASPRVFVKSLDIGKEQLLIFVVTIAGVLASNLLAGVVIGMAAKLLIHLIRGVPLKNLLTISCRVERQNGDTYVVKLEGSAIFSNIATLKSELAALPDGMNIIFDFTDAYLIDHTVMNFVSTFKTDYAVRGGRCELRGLDNHESYANHELAARINKRLG
ncbi:MAG: solute carrier family 23 protein [Methylomonas sp.]|nr:solute carrier family 23 protein [Methylomonas sp.]